LANPASTPPPSAMAEAVSAASAARVLESALPALGETTLSTPRPVPLAAMRPDSGLLPRARRNRTQGRFPTPKNSPSWVYRGQLAIAPYAIRFWRWIRTTFYMPQPSIPPPRDGTGRDACVSHNKSAFSQTRCCRGGEVVLTSHARICGICCDAWRNVYISKDTGERAGSCVFSYTGGWSAKH
jgi:hypothetical protein